MTSKYENQWCSFQNNNFGYFQCRRLPNYFLQNVNHFRGKSPAALDSAAKSIWRLFRELITNPDALETL